VPNIKSAKKRVLVSAKKNAANKNNKSEVKTAIKKLNAVIDSGNYEEAVKLYPETASIIDASVSKGVYHRNTAANKKSGLAKKINALKNNA
jgi:small subunit ribosomal protein S20